MSHEFNLSFVCYLLMIMSIFGVRNCPWSQQTVKTTDSCPKDKSEMEERSKGKNCEALAQIQNCTEPQKFKYHCVINELGNAIVEVCAEAYYIHGYCPEYNTYGAVVQAHFNLKCSEVQPPCPGRYLSTESYLYSSCMETVKKQTRNTPMVYEGLKSHNESGPEVVYIYHLTIDIETLFWVIVDHLPHCNLLANQEEQTCSGRILHVPDNVPLVNNTSITVIAVVVPVVAVLVIVLIGFMLYIRSALNKYFSLVVDSHPEPNA